MLIRSLKVDRYGVCRNTDISDIKDDLVVIYGPNEAGKTTCMEFIRGVFYGLANDGRLKYVRGNATDIFGGSISIENEDGQSWVVSRELNNNLGNLSEKLDVLVGGQLHSVATMNRELLSNVDHQVFRNVFTVGLDELQHLNTLNATEAAEFLYEMTTGMDRVSLGEVLRGVAQTRHSIFDGNNQESEIAKLALRLEQIDESINNDLRQVEAWSQLRNELRAGKQDIEQLTAESHVIEREVKLLEIVALTRSTWIKRCESLERLESLPRLSDDLARIVEGDSIIRLRESNAKRVAIDKEIQEVSQNILAYKAQIDSIPINANVAANAMRIHSVCEHSSWLVSLQDQIAALKKDVTELNNQNDFQLSNGLMDHITGPMPEIDQRVLRAVSQVETELTFAEERFAEQQTLVDTILNELKEVQRAWLNLVAENAPNLIFAEDTVRAEFDEIGFEDLLIDVGSRIKAVRTRLELDDQQKRLQRDIEAVNESIVNNSDTFPTAKVLALSAVLTIVGFAAMVVGFIFPQLFKLESALGSFIGFLGIASSATGISYRILKSHQKQQKVRNAEKRRTLLGHQNTQCVADIATLDASRTLSEAPWDIQLRDLRDQHTRLESMVPMLGKVKTENARYKLARTRLDDCQRNSKEARASWRNVLIELGLPSQLLPHDLHAIAENSDLIALRKRRLDDRNAELLRRESDLKALVIRIEQLLIDMEIQPESTEASAQIRQLGRLLSQHRDAKQQRKSIRKSSRKLKKLRNKKIAEQQALQTSLNRAFIRAGVSDLTELEKLAKSHIVTLEMRARCIAADDAILQQLKDKQFTEDELHQKLKEHDELSAKEQTTKLQNQLQELSDALAHLYEDQGKKKQTLQYLLDDTTLENAKSERAVVREKLEEAQRRWRVWAVTEYVLNQVRDVYEADRQPETLIDAGQWLSKISDGKYSRIWTPLDEDALFIDDASGQTWGVDTLSRGTRESVFICLRLALVNSYIRRGVRLPLILDDVLVNCDALRAKHGVAMLRDFAQQGAQVFFFTCHNHLTNFFEAVDADVRELELRTDIVAPSVPRFSSVDHEANLEPCLNSQLLPAAIEELEVDFDNESQKRQVSISDYSEQKGSSRLDLNDRHDLVTNEQDLIDASTDTTSPEEDLAEEDLAEDKSLSTKQAIEGVDRIVEAVAVEMGLVDSGADDAISDFETTASTNMDIGELVEKAMQESGFEDDEEQYDEIEIIDEADCEMEIGGSEELMTEAESSKDEVKNTANVDVEDDLAA